MRQSSLAQERIRTKGSVSRRAVKMLHQRLQDHDQRAEMREPGVQTPGPVLNFCDAAKEMPRYVC